jgi:hypothetical protein
MDQFLQFMLMTTALSASRQDDQVSRQGVMNHQTTAHLTDLAFVRDMVEMSIPESYAVQGLSMAHTPREAIQSNLASQSPKA